MSSDQMQRLFGKMLAGEIRKPATYSVRTVKLMGQMDADIATIFRKFCSMTASYVLSDGKYFDSRVLTLGSNTNRLLGEYGIHWLDVVALAEYGLISETSPFNISYIPALAKTPAEGKCSPITYCNEKFLLVPNGPKVLEEFLTDCFEYGIGLSRVGRELIGIVDFEENHAYTKALINYFESKGLEFRRVTD